MLWEELVIRFEWQFDIKKAYEDANLTAKIKEVVEEAEIGIKFEFSEQMVKDWVASITEADQLDDGLFESFMRFVSSREQRSIHTQSQQKRIKELVDSMIAKKKLPPIWEKNK